MTREKGEKLGSFIADMGHFMDNARPVMEARVTRKAFGRLKPNDCRIKS